MAKTPEQKREYQRQYRARQKQELEDSIREVMAQIQAITDDEKAHGNWLLAQKEELETSNAIIEAAMQVAEHTLLQRDIDHVKAVIKYWQKFFERFEELMNADPHVQRCKERDAFREKMTKEQS